MIASSESKVLADRHSLPEPEPAKGCARRASLSLSAPRSISLPPSQRAFAARVTTHARTVAAPRIVRSRDKRLSGERAREFRLR